MWFVGHETSSYRDVVCQFDMSLSTLHHVINEVSNFFCSLAEEAIQWPSVADQDLTTQYYLNQKGMPGVIGMIDGTHIKIDKPHSNPIPYYNRKKYFSIVLQGISDHKKKFTDIFIGFPGSCHDARIFRDSDVREKLRDLRGDRWILGDSAYPCLKYLLTPYRDNGHLNELQRHFNKTLSSARVHIKHTFRILKQRFRILYHIKLKNIELIVKIIKSCCVLHNLSDIEDLNNMEPPLEEKLSENMKGQWTWTMLAIILEIMYLIIYIT